MDWQEQQRRDREHQAEQQRAQQEQLARQRREQDNTILQQRLEREKQQRQEQIRKQAEFDVQERQRIKLQREQSDRNLIERHDRDKEAAKVELGKRRSRPVQSNLSPPLWSPRSSADSVPDNSQASLEYPFGTHPQSPEVQSSRGKTPAFPFVDEWFDNFLGPPPRAQKILGLFALVGCILGIGYAEFTHGAVLSYGVAGAFVGFIFIYILKVSVKIAFGACILSAVGLLVYALFQLAK